MQTAVFVAEKNDIIKQVKPIYEKIKNQLPYRIVAWQPLAGHIIGYNDKKNSGDKKQWSWDDLPYFPDDMKNYDFGKMSPQDPTDYYAYIPKKNAASRISSLKGYIKRYNPTFIINAGDSDAEGSILAREVLSYVGVPLTKEKRFWNNEMTDKGITQSFKNLLPTDHKFSDGSSILHIYQAAQMRVIMDQVLGYSYTEAVTLKAKSLISLGRVQAPTLAIVAQRELENKNFVPETYYTISEDFNAPEGKFTGNLIAADGTELKLKDKAKAEQIASDLGNVAQIAEIKKHVSESTAPKVNSTVTMERKMSKLGYKTKKQTDPALEGLYLPAGIMTYPRTDTQYMETDTAKNIPAILEACKCVPKTAPYVDQILNNSELIQKVGKDKNYFNSSKTSSHEALRLTGKKFDFNKLNSLQKAIVTELAVSFVKLFLPKKKSAITDIMVNNNNHIFKAHGSIVMDAGWTVLNSGKTKDTILPDVKDKENINALPANVAEKQTTPSGFYSESDLLGVMNNVQTLLDDKDAKKRLKGGLKVNGKEQYAQGIGTPSTRGTIIEKLIKNKLIELKGKSKNAKFHATERGIQIYQALKSFDIMSPIFTANMEDSLAKVMLGKTSVEEYNTHLQGYIAKQVEMIKNSNQIPEFKSEYHYEEFKTPFTWKGLPVVKVTGGKYGTFYSITDEKSDKRYIFSAGVSDYVFTDDEIQSLLDGKVLEDLPLKVKSGNIVKYDIMLDPKTLKLRYRRKDVADTGIKYKGNELKLYPEHINAKTNKKVSAYYAVKAGKGWLSFFVECFGHKWTNDEISVLLSGKVVKQVPMKFSNGESKVDAKMELTGKNKGKIDLIFSQKKEYGEKMNIVIKGVPVYKEKSKAGKPYYKWDGHFLPAKWSTHVFTESDIQGFYSGKVVSIDYVSANGENKVSDLKYNFKTNQLEFVN